MQIIGRTATAAALLLAGLGTGTASANQEVLAENTCRVIDALPHEITEPGRYCLRTHLITPSSDGAAITISASDVSLDLRGFSITSTVRDTRKRVVGILARDQKNITIQRGKIEGFRYGVLITDSAAVSAGHQISRLLVSESTAAGISVTGASSTIEDNTVSRTGGGGSYAAGISYSGSLGRIRRNWVLHTFSTARGGYAAGIDLLQGPTQSVQHNHIFRVAGPSSSFGIRCGAPFADPRFGNVVEHAAIPFSDCTPSPDPSPSPYPYPSPYLSFDRAAGGSAPLSAQTLGFSALGGMLLAAGLLVSKQFSS